MAVIVPDTDGQQYGRPIKGKSVHFCQAQDCLPALCSSPMEQRLLETRAAYFWKAPKARAWALARPGAYIRWVCNASSVRLSTWSSILYSSFRLNSGELLQGRLSGTINCNCIIFYSTSAQCTGFLGRHSGRSSLCSLSHSAAQHLMLLAKHRPVWHHNGNCTWLAAAMP